MNTDSFLDSASDLAFAKLDAVGGNLNALPKVLKTIVVIYSAQGLIDNGGLEYFFGNDFPNNPPYSQFIDAYREIGATTVANTIEKSLAFFEISQPELNLELRLKFIESLPSDYSHEFSKLSTSICGDESVWSLLEQYAENHRTEIEYA